MEKLEFSKYLRALKGIPERSESCADKESFDKLPEKFFVEYECTFKKHVSERWRSGELISYMLGGEPSLAKELTIAVNHPHSILKDGVAVVEDDEVETAEPSPPYTFTDTNVALSEFHKMSRGSVSRD